VFCGSSPGRNDQYRDAAGQLGKVLVERGVELVYGGASVGIMGEVADAVLAGGGTAIGVIPKSMTERELAHSGLTELHVVASMHERKALMASLADAFLALPGGAGTMEELFEVWTWAQLGLHTKPIGLLDVAGYFQPLLRFMDHMVTEEFLSSSSREMLVVDTDPRRLLDRYASYQPPREKWWDKLPGRDDSERIRELS
jgi:uncharacterized protein (TIGR00730 family)